MVTFLPICRCGGNGLRILIRSYSGVSKDEDFLTVLRKTIPHSRLGGWGRKCCYCMQGTLKYHYNTKLGHLSKWINSYGTVSRVSLCSYRKVEKGGGGRMAVALIFEKQLHTFGSPTLNIVRCLLNERYVLRIKYILATEFKFLRPVSKNKSNTRL